MSATSLQYSGPNELELAILARLAVAGCPFDAATLNVISREFTGAGSYTTFATPSPPGAEGRSQVGLERLIEVPGVPNGLGAVLWLRGDMPQCLEIYTYGEDSWDGSFAGYKLV